MMQLICPPMPHYLVCGEDTYPTGGRHPDRSRIGVFDLLLVTKGCLFIDEEQRELSITPGSFAILRPDLTHRTVRPCEEVTHFYWLHFSVPGAWSENNRAAANDPLSANSLSSTTMPASTQADGLHAPRLFIHLLPRLAKLLSPEAAILRMRQLLQLQADGSTAAHWRQQMLFLELLQQLQEETRLPARSAYLIVAEDTAAFLRRHYREVISYKQISEQLHFHANYLSLCMKRAYGCTPLAYLTGYRLEQAKRLLIHTDAPIGQIADRCGFGSLPYFIRCFQRLEQTSPRQFRQRYRDDGQTLKS